MSKMLGALPRVELTGKRKQKAVEISIRPLVNMRPLCIMDKEKLREGMRIAEKRDTSGECACN